MRLFLFLFILGVVQSSSAGRLTLINFNVTCAVSCRFLRCCSYMGKAQVNFLRRKWLDDPWQRTQIQIKPKLPWKSVDIGYPCWARKTRNSCHNWTACCNTFSLDNQRASAWNITSLCLLSCLCTLLKTYDASLNVRGWISHFLASSRTIPRHDVSGYILK